MYRLLEVDVEEKTRSADARTETVAEKFTLSGARSAMLQKLGGSHRWISIQQ